MAYDIACAMSYLHSRKIIFRDMKSKNLLVSKRQLKIFVTTDPASFRS